jgi:EmrB/QacA subfamily drug resistance transporter
MDAKARPVDPHILSHQEIRLVVAGTLLPVFMASLDSTILASALPTIGRDFGDVHSLPWLITAYLIASTAITPLYGKIADIRGRRFTLLLAIAAHMTGSLVCALAPSMVILILGRVLQGFGGGGLASMGMVILGDVAAPKDRGRYYAYFSATYTTAGACGPLLGGFLADYLHWSVIFWLNVPLGLVAIVLGGSLLRRLPRHERPHRLDFLGAALIMVASSALMLALSMGGVRLPWLSLPILGLIAAGLLVGGGFVLRLVSAPEPLIPLAILRDPVARCVFVTNSFGWAAIIGLNIFLPMYLQSVMGLSPTSAGLCLMVLMATLNASAGVTGQIIGRMRHYKAVPMIGMAIAVVSVLILALKAHDLSLVWFEVLLALVGIGFGASPPLSATALQNTVSPHQFGIAIGTMNFTRNLLATILVAVFGAIVLAGIPEAEHLAPGGLTGLAQAAGVEGFRRIFLAAAVSFAVALFGIILLEQKPLRTNIHT